MELKGVKGSYRPLAPGSSCVPLVASGRSTLAALIRACES